MVWQAPGKGLLTTKSNARLLCPHQVTHQHSKRAPTGDLNVGATAALAGLAFLKEACAQLVSQRIVLDEHRCFSVLERFSGGFVSRGSLHAKKYCSTDQTASGRANHQTSQSVQWRSTSPSWCGQQRSSRIPRFGESTTRHLPNQNLSSAVAVLKTGGIRHCRSIETEVRCRTFRVPTSYDDLDGTTQQRVLDLIERAKDNDIHA